PTGTTCDGSSRSNAAMSSPSVYCIVTPPPHCAAPATTASRTSAKGQSPQHLQHPPLHEIARPPQLHARISACIPERREPHLLPPANLPTRRFQLYEHEAGEPIWHPRACLTGEYQVRESRRASQRGTPPMRRASRPGVVGDVAELGRQVEHVLL